MSLHEAVILLGTRDCNNLMTAERRKDQSRIDSASRHYVVIGM